MASYIVLQDAGLNFWQWGVTTEGQMGTPTLGGTAVQNNFINDPSGVASWQLTISRQGAVTSTSVALNSAYPRSFNLTDPRGLTWPVRITVQGQIYVAASAGIVAMDWTPTEDGAQNFDFLTTRYKQGFAACPYDEDSCAAIVYPTLPVGNPIRLLPELDPDTTSRNFDQNTGPMVPPEAELYSPVYPTVRTFPIGFQWETDADVVASSRWTDYGILQLWHDDLDAVPQNFFPTMDWTADYDWQQWRDYHVVEDEDVPRAKLFDTFLDWSADEAQARWFDKSVVEDEDQDKISIGLPFLPTQSWDERDAMPGWGDMFSPAIVKPATVPFDEILRLPSTPSTYIVLQDSLGQFWQIGVTTYGQLMPPAPGGNQVQNNFINDAATNSTTWQLTVTPTGTLVPMQIAYSPSVPSSINLIDSDGVIWTVHISVYGTLYVTPTGAAVMDWTQPTEDASARDLTWRVVMQDDADNDVKFTPATMIPLVGHDQDAEESRWFGWWVVTDEDSRESRPFIPTMDWSLSLEDASQKWSDYRVVEDEDVPASAAFSPTMDWTQTNDDGSQKWLGWWVVVDEDAPAARPFFPTMDWTADYDHELSRDTRVVEDEDERVIPWPIPVLIPPDMDFSQVYPEAYWFDYRIVEDEDSPAARPFIVTADWNQTNDDATQHWTDAWTVEDEDAPAARPFFVTTDWTADYDHELSRDVRVVEDEDAPAPQPFSPTADWTQSNDDSSQRWTGWWVVEDEDVPAARPFAVISDWTADYDHAWWRDTRVVEDEDEREMLIILPPPPVVTAYDQDAQESRWTDLWVVEDEDEREILPLPNLVLYQEMEGQRWTDYWVVEDEDERVISLISPPMDWTPVEDGLAKSYDYSVVEDEDFYNPVPYVPILAWDEVDWQHSCDWWVVEDEDEREIAWPIPILIVPSKLFIRRRTTRAWRLALSGTQTGA